jgi:hypothetical protein
MATAMVLHGLWDSAGGVVGALDVGGLGLIVYWVLVAAPAVAVVVTVFRLAVPRERRFVHAVLAPEVENGTLTREELDTLSGDAKARRRYRTAAPGSPTDAGAPTAWPPRTTSPTNSPAPTATTPPASSTPAPNSSASSTSRKELTCPVRCA